MSDTRIGWKFPETDDGPYDGFNASGIEIFAGARFRSLAREVLQNSLDARVEDKKVTVVFEVVRVPRNIFPGRAELSQAIQACRLEDTVDRKADNFLKNAANILEEEEIPCLQIIDYGTTGLRGEAVDRSGQWFAITKASGINVKSSPTAGGSYGIGKNAPFAVSGLRTVFYSTRYKADGKLIERAQGKSILMSRESQEPNGALVSGTGFYGVTDRCQPLEGKHIPKFLRLKEEGTMILVAGFSDKEDWKNRIVSAVVSNFFYAIDQGALQVLIQGEDKEPRIIDQDSLPLELDNEALSRFEGIPNAKVYYEIIKKGEEVVERDMQLRRGLGCCHLWTKVGEGLPRQVALLRKTGMLITDEHRRMKRWPGFSDFAAVCICTSDEGNGLLRRMENPQHDAFEPDRLGDDQKKGENALKELENRVRDTIREIARPSISGPVDLDELRDYLPDRDPDESLPGEGEGEEADLDGAPRYQPKPIKRKADPLPDGEGDQTGGDGTGEDGEGEGEGEGGDGDHGGDESTDGNGGDGTHGGGGGRKGSIARIDKVRVLHVPEDGKKKTVMFTPLESGKAKISLQIAGDSYSELLVVEKVRSGGELADKNSIWVDMEEGIRMSLEVTLEEVIGDAVLVSASKQQEEGDEIRGE